MGSIYIADNVLSGAVAFPDHAEIVNTAVLTGVALQTNINVYAGRVSGTFLKEEPARSCASSLSSAAKVDGVCQKVVLDGSETSGADTVTITMNVTGLSQPVLMPLRVWAPTLPLVVKVEDSSLSAVKNWRNSSTCKPLYERTKVDVMATFACEGSSFEARVLPLVAGKMVVGNSSIVELSIVRDGSVAVDAVLRGVGAGVSNVSVVVGGKGTWYIKCGGEECGCKREPHRRCCSGVGEHGSCLKLI